MNVWCAVVSTPVPVASGLMVQDRQEAWVAERNTVAEVVTQVKGPSPIKFAVLETWLQDYTRREDASYVLSSFKEGFRIPAVGERKAFFAKKLKSIHGMEKVVQVKIAKEVRGGRVLGAFTMPPLDTLRVLPLGIVPKKAPWRVQINPASVLS